MTTSHDSRLETDLWIFYVARVPVPVPGARATSLAVVDRTSPLARARSANGGDDELVRERARARRRGDGRASVDVEAVERDVVDATTEGEK